MNHLKQMYTPDQADLPYEKFKAIGAEQLTEAELLAIIIRTGTHGISPLALSQQILEMPVEKNGILGLHHLSLDELMSLKGIGEVKAIKIKCIAELSNRISKAKAATSVSFQQPETIAAYYMEQLRHKEYEEVLLVMLDGKNTLLEDCVVSKGSINASILAPREIFLKALGRKAVYILLLHNHPSGDPMPSKQDIRITKLVKEGGDLIGIPLLDHIIIGDNQYISFREKGLL